MATTDAEEMARLKNELRLCKSERDRALGAIRTCVDALHNGSKLTSECSVEMHLAAPAEIQLYCKRARELLADKEFVVRELKRILADDRLATTPDELAELCGHERAIVAEEALRKEAFLRQRERLLGFQHGWDEGVNAWQISTGLLVRMLMELLRSTEKCSYCDSLRDGCQSHEVQYTELMALLERRLGKPAEPS